MPAACLIRSCVNEVSTENSPKGAGVVLRIARSDHCLWVWELKFPRITNQQRIFCGSASRLGTPALLCWETSVPIAHQNPAQGYGELARAVPHGRRRSDLV